MAESSSPLSLDEMARIEATKLPILERHHLRLLSHCLASFKLMRADAGAGALPSPSSRREWLLQQQSVASDPGFLDVLIEQFEAAAQQLEHLAAGLAIHPLELTLDDLIQACSEKRQKQA
ncbi:MAG: hypothetical protein AB8E87_05365 [Prochlorococcus sp.]|nr:hypothetical protein [Prochlorococcaceae cyanobacterium Fu_MAG_50]